MGDVGIYSKIAPQMTPNVNPMKSSQSHSMSAPNITSSQDVSLVDNSASGDVGKDNYRKRPHSTPQMTSNVNPMKVSQSRMSAPDITSSQDVSLVDNSASGMTRLKDLRMGQIRRLQKIWEERIMMKGKEWDDVLPDDITYDDSVKINASKNPFREFFNLLVSYGWTLGSFMEMVKDIASDEVYGEVCSVVGWNPPSSPGAVGGIDEEPKIINKPETPVFDQPPEEFQVNPGQSLETDGSSQQPGSDQDETPCSQTPDRIINVLQPPLRPNNAMASCLKTEDTPSSSEQTWQRGSRASRPTGSAARDQRPSSQIESFPLHRVVCTNPELSSRGDHSQSSEGQGSLPRGVQAQSDTDGQQAEKSPGIDAEYIREDISAQSPISGQESKPLPSGGASVRAEKSSVQAESDTHGHQAEKSPGIDAEYFREDISAQSPISGQESNPLPSGGASVRAEKSSVQAESDTHGHQAEKGPGLEAERLQEDISASCHSETKALPIPSVEDPEGFQAEKCPDVEAQRLQEDRRAEEELGFRNIQEESERIGMCTATGHSSNASRNGLVGTALPLPPSGDLVETTASSLPPGDAQTSTNASSEVTNTAASGLSPRDAQTSTTADCEATTAFNFQSTHSSASRSTILNNLSSQDHKA
ncbi:retinitis pigmentosa 1-like 1 protein [Liolophura sinensis]|uniref:retinitis pigmentosa 1-like 1 protein n=1 Tax=Liolophura sinensis TaxID=3198878 RepID=UPI003158B509